ncbi:uncharacterized protein N7477_006216 [Penicillium maclennaniae]|uniref:uncharacterized protein n=1 Tax=Penicillium maclennaniae TaxID=1343394 RepID=UPI002541F175|nr:uncharacterized protein N7477_006216 [Penicillium maclennaniae]KAJ5670853.1 hypothetical protein N7477_006216 [Penicillium maclennaniae]
MAQASPLERQLELTREPTNEGIGKVTAYSFAKHGVHQLALADINLSAAQTAAREIQSMAKTVGQFGRIDFAVKNAGIGRSMDLSAEHNVEEWSKTLDVDMTLSSRAKIRVMLRQEKLKNSSPYYRGVIINLASIHALIATSLCVPVVTYTASKHRVIGFTWADAVLYAPNGIRINAMCPGYVATSLVQSIMQTDVIQKEIPKIPASRMVEMVEIADHITFLASPMSSYIYGAAMLADG